MKLLIEPSALLLLTKLSSFLTGLNVQSYIVGGFVRDVLLKRDTADIDIAITADALEIAPKIANALNGKFVALDRINKVGRVILANKGETSTKGQLNLDFSTIEGTIEQDLARRDFTIDAMAIDLKQLSAGNADVPLIDPFNGRNDLQPGVIRAVTRTVFESDAARLLRAVRLAAELGFSIDKETEALIQSQAHLIAGVAGERTREELLRLLAIPETGQLLPYLDKLGIITAMIPELAETKEVSQPKEHYWNVFDHSLKTVVAVDFLLRQGTWSAEPDSNRQPASEKILAATAWSTRLAQHFASEVSSGSTRRLLMKLAALLHDVAKPQTKAIDANGRIRFLGHAQEGAIITTTIMERLRFSAKEIKLVETMVKHHLRPGQMTHDELLPSHRAIYRYFRDTGETGIDILFLNLADHLATRGPKLKMAQWQEHCQISGYILTQRFEQETLVIPPKLVDGDDLIHIFGMNPGPEIGNFLEQVREAQASGELDTKEEAIYYIREHLLSKAA